MTPRYRDKQGWTVRFSLHGKRREMGIGGNAVTPEEAKRRADIAGRLARGGIDPIKLRRDIATALFE